MASGPDFSDSSGIGNLAMGAASPDPGTELELASQQAERTTGSFPIVGIGASAGGLDAFKSFFSAVPENSGIAFVLVPHLDPKHKSLMAELIARQTTMPVVEASDGEFVRVNSVYIIPPNNYMVIQGGVLRLSPPPETSGSKTAIDFFLRSLATDQNERAIGIILSGTGSHGTLGVREIKRCGGMAIAQAPESAEFEQMPASAIETGLIDFVLPPEQMPETLLKYVKQPYLTRSAHLTKPTMENLEYLRHIIDLLKLQTKYDFRSYRPNMLMRRIERRMGIHQVNDLGHYIELLRSNLEEVESLCKDFLIGVTAFFREPAAYQVLEEHVIPDLVAHQLGDAAIRVWVPSCASGEEAYSIAILFFEAFAVANKPVNLQIFASDINRQSIEVARRGTYPASIISDVSNERLKKFFIATDQLHYQVNKSLRDSIVFSQQNLISDAPFSKLDLVSCRNLLIYLEPEMQQKLIGIFHFALKADGFLMLGPSETIGRSVDMYATISKKWRIYRRIGPIRSDLIKFTAIKTEQSENLPAKKMPPTEHRNSLRDLAERIVLNEFAPAAAVINHRLEVLYVTGPLVNYLEFPMGELTKDLLAMARTGLRIKIRAAVQKAIRDRTTVTDPHARVKRNGVFIPCTVTVRPIVEPNSNDALMLVLFKDRDLATTPKLTSEQESDKSETDVLVEDSPLVQQLEFDLKLTQEELHSTIEEMESSNEELKASNEEVMSMNEELQSANEELESSKEELQSLNEELITVNNQLQDKVLELDKSNSDMTNLMASTEIATVFLDKNLLIKRFTPPTVQLLSLVATDIGRPLRDFAPRFTEGTMLIECQQVLDQLTTVETEIITDDDRCYLRRILPYRTTGKLVDGVVITFLDLTQRKRSEAARREGESRFKNVFDNAATGIAITDWDGKFEQCNPAYCKLIGYSEQELQQINFKSIVHAEDSDSNNDHIARIQAGEMPFFENESRYIRKDGQAVWVRKFVSVLPGDNGKPAHLVALVTNISELRRANADLRESVERMRTILNTASDAIITISQRGIIDSVNSATERLFGYARSELVGQNVSILMPLPVGRQHDGYIKRFQETGDAHIIGIGREVICRRKDGQTFPADLSVSQVDHLGLFTGILRDVSNRKSMQKHILEIAADEQRRIGQELHDGTQQELTGLSLFASALGETLLTASRQSVETESELDSAQKTIETRWEFVDADFERLKKLSSLLSKRLTEANQHVRDLAHGIMPVQIDAEGLRSALRELAAATDSHENISCKFECKGKIAISDNTTASHLYRIAQEAISNAIRHGKASEMLISLTQQGDQLAMEINDNGSGFEPSVATHRESPSSGMGLRTMEYRANMIGGLLEFHRIAKGGTSVRCTLLKGAK